MIKIEKYDGSKTYMFPNGELATPDRVKKRLSSSRGFCSYCRNRRSWPGYVCDSKLSSNKVTNGN